MTEDFSHRFSEDRYEKSTDRSVKRAKARVFIGVGVVVFIALVLIISGVLLLLPYRPMTVHSYTPGPTEACPNELVTVYVDYSVEEGVDIESMEVRGGWEAVDVPDFSPGSEIFVTRATFNAPDDYFTPGRHDRETRAPRLTPLIPGVWSPTSETTIRGWRYGVPHVQTINGAQYSGEHDLRVLEPDDEECS